MNFRLPALVSRSIHDLRSDCDERQSPGMSNDRLISTYVGTEFLKPTLILFEHVWSLPRVSDDFRLGGTA
jgi:hypothetical protein